jgi:uncharacterized protein YbcC (UPF0753/DUF2309 family)
VGVDAMFGVQASFIVGSRDLPRLADISGRTTLHSTKSAFRHSQFLPTKALQSAGPARPRFV